MSSDLTARRDEMLFAINMLRILPSFLILPASILMLFAGVEELVFVSHNMCSICLPAGWAGMLFLKPDHL